MIIDIANVVYTRDDIPLKVIFEHLIKLLGLTCVSHEIQDLERILHWSISV